MHWQVSTTIYLTQCAKISQMNCILCNRLMAFFVAKYLRFVATEKCTFIN